MIFTLLSCFNSKEEATEWLSVDEVSAAIEAASEGLLRVNPILMHNGWTRSMSTLSDENCPPMEEHNGMDLWRESCTTEDGHQFLGWSLNFRGQNIPTDCCILDDFYWLSGQAQIINADGTLLQNFGDILHQQGQDNDGNPVIQGFTYGDFYWDDPQAENSWLLSELSMEYYYTFTQKDDFETIDIQAWISGFDPIYTAAIFDSIVFNTKECAQEPLEGELWVRDSPGLWYQVLYDGSDNCDGCGSVFHGEIELGQTCTNFDVWFDWDEYPWEDK